MTRYTIRLFSMLAGVAWLAAVPAAAAELVLFEADGCRWCEAWNAEIGEIYSKTAESRIAPLRRVDIHGQRPDDLAHLRGIVYTPTFVLMEDGREVGRITGYAGEEFFWGLLGVELKKLNGNGQSELDFSASSAIPVTEGGEGK